jgi:hypothetical protein
VELVGLDGRAAERGAAGPEVVYRWRVDGIVPNGQTGRGFARGSLHHERVALRALTNDMGEKVMQAGHQRSHDLSAPARRICPGAQPQRGSADGAVGELAAALAVPGQGDAVVGQVDVVEFEMPDGAVACDVIGSEGFDDLNFVTFVG